ncbi:hypothetical protein BBK36DRAFT_1138745 [Trichoderma citrinoviride]|uniref:Cora-domain-containing protein n=1 Tax=Trichoderma citrinoviride TaxID=58853 RepID=A0A2T4BH46_9HYPO|nr:hypothetical protein BBK36DRAFT_1138745 [Trichoderma citrinoviride]PTB68643.1 hypothetical protein BBK36DRAFT_1138745 [Trichoderma citrinoviride]
MEEIYQKLSVVNLWEGFSNSDDTSFQVIEARHQHASGKISINRKLVYFKELDSWLAEGTEGDDGDTSQSLVLRLALIGCDIKRKLLKLSKDVLDPLLDEFNLELAYTYSQSCITNVSAIPSRGQQTYSFCYMPKLVAVWSQKSFARNRSTDRVRPNLTQGLILVEESNKGFLSDTLCSPWDARLYASPMFPALLFSMILSMQVHFEEAKIKVKLREIEERTGQDRIAAHKQEATTESYIKLAAQVDRHAVKLASVSRKSKMAEKTLSFVLQNTPNSAFGPSFGSTPPNPSELLRSHVTLLQDRLAMQAVDIEYTLRRVQLQINTLAGIISRDDVKANLDLAESQHRDSLSMKTLAIVTMVFLPGSFISALFSTSMFDWDSIDPGAGSIAVRTMPQFGLYWAITVPLTVVTFLLYFFWLRVMKRQRDRRKTSFDQLSAEEKGEASGIGLAKLRKEGTEVSKKSTMPFGNW